MHLRSPEQSQECEQFKYSPAEEPREAGRTVLFGYFSFVCTAFLGRRASPCWTAGREPQMVALAQASGAPAKEPASAVLCRQEQ